MGADENSVHGRIALTFARHVAAGRLHDAHALLCTALRQQYTQEDLGREYVEMVGCDPGTADCIDLISTLTAWPDRQVDDIGWAYVAISGDAFCEAVSVVVAGVDGQPLVRDLSWGRP